MVDSLTAFRSHSHEREQVSTSFLRRVTLMMPALLTTAKSACAEDDSVKQHFQNIWLYKFHGYGLTRKKT